MIPWSEFFTTWVEFVGFVTGILSVALLLPTKRPRLQYTNWIFALLNGAAYVWIHYTHQLYGNSLLNFYFVVAAVIGLWTWRGQWTGDADVKEIPTTYAHIQTTVTTLALAAIAFVPTWIIFAHFNDSSAKADATMVALSAAAIYLQIKKYVQSWFIWIAVDIIAIPLYYSQDLRATAVLYVLFMIMCVIGAVTWHKEAKEHANTLFDERFASIRENHIRIETDQSQKREYQTNL